MECDDDVDVLPDVDPIQPFFGDKYLVEIQSDDTRDFENEDEYYDLNDMHRKKYPFPYNKVIILFKNLVFECVNNLFKKILNKIIFHGISF